MPILGGYYGTLSNTEANFKEQQPMDWYQWATTHVPPLLPQWTTYTTMLKQYDTRFDNGPGVYKVTFKAGGVDTLTLSS